MKLFNKYIVTYYNNTFIKHYNDRTKNSIRCELIEIVIYAQSEYMACSTAKCLGVKYPEIKQEFSIN